MSTIFRQFPALGRWSALLLLFTIAVTIVTCDNQAMEEFPKLNHKCVHDHMSELVKPVALQFAGENGRVVRNRQINRKRIQNNDFQSIRIMFTPIYNNDTERACYFPGQVIKVSNIGNTLCQNQSNCNYTCQETDVVTEEKKKVLQDDILPSVASTFQSMLLTRRLVDDVTTPSTCFDFQIPIREISSDTTDLLIVIAIRPSPSILGYASACGFERMYGRPVLGIMNINPYYLNSTYTDSIIETAVHETIHVLGFSYNLFDRWINSDGDVIGLNNVVKTENKTFVDEEEQTTFKVVKKLITPNLQNAVRQHFNCPEEDGAQLEEFGGADTINSHFAATIFMNELMTSSDAYKSFTRSTILSQFSRALLADTGWYKISPSFNGASLVYGGKTGCSILQKRCESWNLQSQGFEGYYCDKLRNRFNQVINRCTFDLSSIGFCGIVNYGKSLGYYEHLPNATLGGLPEYNYCPIVARFTKGSCNPGYNQDVPGNFGQVYGPRSACFNANATPSTTQRLDKDARCYQYDCSKKRLSISVLNYTIICPLDQSAMRITTGLPEGYDGYIECPRNGYNILCTGEGQSMYPIPTVSIPTVGISADNSYYISTSYSIHSQYFPHITALLAICITILLIRG